MLVTKRNPPGPDRACRGFTLVELLFVISILAILGALSLTLIGGARHDANEARTETQIRRIKQFIEARLEDYSVRVIPFRPSERNLPMIKNRTLIEYVRAEMPCRTYQLTTYPSAHYQNDFPTDYVTLQGLSLSQRDRMVRKLTGALDGTEVDQAECLYEILNSHNDYARSGLDFIFQKEIGDTDNDGHFEILDAWGDPIRFTLHMHDHVDPADDVNGDGEVNLDDLDPDGAMNSEGPLAVHIDVTSIHLPQESE
jgi:prepilin-type N-terminal cleavage/methylation domain-containing protein